MNRSTAGRIAWSLVAVGVAFAATGVLIMVLGDTDAGGDVLPFIGGAAVFVAASVVGGLVATRQPRNPIGWLFCGFSFLNGLFAFAIGYTEEALGDGGPTGAGRYVAWLANWSYVWLFVLVIFVLLLFPDGRLPSRRWRFAAWCGGLGAAAFAFGIAFDPGPMEDYDDIQNPLGLSDPLARIVENLGSLATMVALGAAVVSVVVRFRRADGIARLQIKWLAAAGVIALTGATVGGAVTATGHDNAGNLMTVLGMLCIPVAIGVAMLRYRLYDVDRVISRTLTYGAVTLVLAAAYVGLVLVGQAVFSSIAGGGDLAIAVSTLIVAALFLPLRSRIQGFVDRRFYRRRYDAQRTLTSFGSRLRNEIDLDGLATDLRGVVVDTMQPTTVSLWLRGDRR